ncbi:MAG: adenine deaminase [Candidatus Nanoarchaeia archaeon]
MVRRGSKRTAKKVRNISKNVKRTPKNAKKTPKNVKRTPKNAKKTLRKAKALKKTKVVKKAKRKARAVKKQVKKEVKKTNHKTLTLEGQIVDVISKKIFPGKITFEAGKITNIEKLPSAPDHFILPGLVDSLVRIESSLLVPSRFAQAVAPHGTVATISDPRCIANVLGVKGINYMIREAKKTPLKMFFTAPSCVPATKFETSGATLNPDDIEMLLKVPSIVALGSMMQVQALLSKDKTVLAKIKAAKQNKKPVDGHCPGLSGDELKKYYAAGISTDHTSRSVSEAAEKARLGMKILIQEGCSLRMLEELLPVAKNARVTSMMCTNDLCNPGEGHIDLLLKKAVALGLDPLRAIQMVSLNPVRHYKLPVGLLQRNDPADCVIVNNLSEFNVLESWIDGKQVVRQGRILFTCKQETLHNSMKGDDKSASDFQIRNYSNKERQIVRVIRARDGQPDTMELHASLPVDHSLVLSEPAKDVLKIAVVERYGKNRLGLGFVNGFGLKQGAIASSIGHDSHNIIVVGATDEAMAKAVNELRKTGGGMSVYNQKVVARLSLPVAGLMSTKTPSQVQQEIQNLHEEARKLGCVMNMPFLTLSYMSMLLSPSIKLSDKGVFSTGSGFKSLFVEL